MTAAERQAWHDRLDAHLNREDYQEAQGMRADPVRLVIYSENVYGAALDTRSGRYNFPPGALDAARRMLPSRVRRLLERAS